MDEKTKEYLKKWCGEDFTKDIENFEKTMKEIEDVEKSMQKFEELDKMMKKFKELEETMKKIDYEEIPKELIKKEETPYGTKIQVGPITYGVKITKIGDNPPEIEEWGNVREYKKLSEKPTEE